MESVTQVQNDSNAAVAACLALRHQPRLNACGEGYLMVCKKIERGEDATSAIGALIWQLQHLRAEARA